MKLRQLALLRIDFSHSKRVLTIHNTTYEDSGLYECRAASDIGIVRSSEQVTVQVRGEVCVHSVCAATAVPHPVNCSDQMRDTTSDSKTMSHVW